MGVHRKDPRHVVTIEPDATVAHQKLCNALTAVGIVGAAIVRIDSDVNNQLVRRQDCGKIVNADGSAGGTPI